MIFDMKMMALGGVGIAAVTALTVWPMASGQGYDRGKREVTVELEAAKRVGTRLLAERDQARAEVDKVNAAIAAQVKELATLMSADQTERVAAAARMEAAAINAAKEAKLAGQRALAAREIIQNVADQCARAGVPTDVVRVLRDLSGFPSNMGEGGMSAPQGHN